MTYRSTPYTPSSPTSKNGAMIAMQAMACHLRESANYRDTGIVELISVKKAA